MADNCDTLTESDLASFINLSELNGDEHIELSAMDLKKLLNDDQVQACKYWEDVGLELELPKSVIDTIAENQNKEEGNCKREMLYKWLISCMNPTLAKLHQAIDIVAARRLKEMKKNRKDAKEDERKAEESVEYFVTLLDDWEKRNQKLTSHQEELAADLQEEVMWFEKVKSWNVEKAEWQHGESGTKRARILQAIQQGSDFIADSDVQQLLQSRNLSSLTKDKKAIKGILHQSLMEIDIDRFEPMEDRYKEMIEHHDRLRLISAEVLEYEKVFEERLTTYDKIRKGLENLGARTDRLIKQFKSLQATADKCRVTNSECANIYQQEEDNLHQWKDDLTDLLTSFEDDIKDMEEHEDAYKDALLLLYGLAGGAAGAAGGAVVGATIGTIVPGVGTAAGLVIGGTAGATAGVIYRLVQNNQAHQEAHRHIRDYKDTLKKGKESKRRINKLLTEY